MEIDFYDTWVSSNDGTLYHFDVLLPQNKNETDAEKVLLAWLARVHPDIGQVNLEANQYCHSEQANESLRQEIEEQGYSILEIH